PERKGGRRELEMIGWALWMALKKPGLATPPALAKVSGKYEPVLPPCYRRWRGWNRRRSPLGPTRPARHCAGKERPTRRTLRPLLSRRASLRTASNALDHAQFVRR